MTWRILIVGVNGAAEDSGRQKLRYAEESAKELGEWLDSHLDPMLCHVRWAPAPSSAMANNLISWLEQARHRILIWTGHVTPKISGEHYLVTSNARAWNDTAHMLALRPLSLRLASGQSDAITAIALDTCYSGAFELPKLLDGAVTGASMFLPSSLPEQMAAESGREQGLAAILLEHFEASAAHAFRGGRCSLDLEEVWRSASKTLSGRRPQSARPDQPTSGSFKLDRQGGPSLELPLRSRGFSPRPSSLGFATQAFREYLGRKVVDGVELIYFLGYDQWDGCLVYDGLVPGSIEQMLLNSIRSRFLDRDRLRSRFEEKRRSGGLGPAGQCFEQALEDFEKLPRPKRPSNADVPSVFIGSPWFMGDFRAPCYENSEYRAYDRLLGLGCCLYLPIVVWNPGQHQQPTGGVIMAAARRPWNLKPLVEGREQLMGKAREQDDPEGADLIAKEVGKALCLPRLIEDGARAHEMDDFIRCIAAVYQERGASGRRFREAVHPRIPKGALRAVSPGDGGYASELNAVIDHVAEKVELHFTEIIAWLDELENDGIGEYLPPPEVARRRPRQEYRPHVAGYLGIHAWRELKLELRRLHASPPLKDSGEVEQLAERLQRKEWRFLGDYALDSWMAERLMPASFSPEHLRDYSNAGDVLAFERDVMQDLIDELRDNTACSTRWYRSSIG